MSKLKIKYKNFNKESGKSTFIYSYGSHSFEGKSKCHKSDMDMRSALVGLRYADTRAFLKYLKFRKAELGIRLSTLEGLLNNMSTSKDFDLNSRYAKKLTTAIKETKLEIEECRDKMENMPKMLERDIETRENLYKKIRKNRQKDA